MVFQKQAFKNTLPSANYTKYLITIKLINYSSITEKTTKNKHILKDETNTLVLWFTLLNLIRL
ncbi:hypothetical protein ZONE111904_20395 [Zobellia nedashkovskayae]